LSGEQFADQDGIGGAIVRLAKGCAIPELLQDQIEIFVEAIAQD
jgi:hypothetical protein